MQTLGKSMLGKITAVKALMDEKGLPK